VSSPRRCTVFFPAVSQALQALGVIASIFNVASDSLSDAASSDVASLSAGRSLLLETIATAAADAAAGGAAIDAETRRGAVRAVEAAVARPGEVDSDGQAAAMRFVRAGMAGNGVLV